MMLAQGVHLVYEMSFVAALSSSDKTYTVQNSTEEATNSRDETPPSRELFRLMLATREGPAE